MHTYDFTLRFDNDAHSLTAYKGIPAEDVGKILIDLTNALGKGHEIVLSEIKGNCYALNITTPDIVTHEILKVIHKRIEKNDFLGLNSEQRKYAGTISGIMRNRHVYLDVYTKDKEEYHVKVFEIIVPEKPRHYFEIGSIYGKITAIGGKTLNGKANIKINDGHFDIEVTPTQERTLLAHYKKTKLLLTIKKKIDFDSGNILSAILEDYEEVSERDFFKGLKNLSNDYPNGLFTIENDEDLVSFIRNKPQEEQVHD
jgi:hypothetical protein